MAADAHTLQDAAARRRAATDFTTNLVVEAGAGTGKTSLLVERALNAIGSGRVSVERLAAITFTEKAAGEMRERIASSLDRLRRLAQGLEVPDAAREADRAWSWLSDEAGIAGELVSARALEAMEQLDAGTVSTIHGFCSELLRSHPVESGVDPEFAVDAGERAELLRREAWGEFVSDELGPEQHDAEHTERWRALLRRVGLADLATLGGALGNLRLPDILAGQDADPAELLRAPVEHVIARIDDLLERQSGSTDNVVSWFSDCRETLQAFLERGADELRARIEGERPKPDKTINPGKRLAGVAPDEFKQVVGETKKLLGELARIDDALVRSAVDLLAPLATGFKERSLRRGFVGFDGLLVLARDLLRDHPAVRSRLKRRFDMLFVDEFQDTDPLQYEIVLFLAEREGTEAVAAFDCKPAPGKLFIVGDPKQSIYRFRGADYSAYREATTSVVGAGGAQLHLTSNFRSVSPIVHAVNELFHERWWRPSSYQPDYVPIDDVVPAAGREPAVEIWSPSPTPGAKVDERRDLEGRLIAEEILRMKRGGECRLRDVTVLFRSFSSISNYLRPLRELGIPFVVDGGREFLRRPEVLQLLGALTAIARPNDPAALLAYLRGPGGGVPDTELAGWAATGGEWRVDARPDPAHTPALCEALERLRELSGISRELPADAVVREVVRRTDLLALGAAAFEGPQRVANLRKLAATAADLARDGTLALDEVIEALREGRSQDIETDRPLADDAAEAVRITSIHRMKGLESDVVFVADLARGAGGRSPESTAARTLRVDDGRTLAGIRLAGAVDAVWARGRIEDVLHGAAEERRVLYVAATRARKRLVVLATVAKGQPSEWVDALRAWGLDPDERPADGALLAGELVLHRAPQPTDATADATRADDDAVDSAVERFHRAREKAVASSQRAIERPSDHDDSSFARTEGSTVDRRAAQALGVAMHRLLERWPEFRGDPRTAFAALCRDEVAAGDLERLLRDAQPVLDAFVGSTLASSLDTIDVVARELPMIHRFAEDRRRHGTIDLLYRDGGLVVADFKTDVERDEDALRARYGSQLRAYADAVAAAWDEPVPRCELWLVRYDRIVTVG